MLFFAIELDEEKIKEDGIRYYEGNGDRDDFWRLWSVNEIWKSDEVLRAAVKRRWFVVEADENCKKLEIEGCLADKWVPGKEQEFSGNYRMYFTAGMDEEKLLENETSKPDAFYKAMDALFKKRDVELLKVEEGIRYYTRNVDKNDFVYLWLSIGALKRANWFQKYRREWKFVIEWENVRDSWELNLMEEWA